MPHVFLVCDKILDWHDRFHKFDMNRSMVLLLLSFVWNLQNELAISASFMHPSSCNWDKIFHKNNRYKTKSISVHWIMWKNTNSEASFTYGYNWQYICSFSIYDYDRMSLSNVKCNIILLFYFSGCRQFCPYTWSCC